MPDGSKKTKKKHIRVSMLSVGAGISLSLAMAPHRARFSAAQRMKEKSFNKIERETFVWASRTFKKSVCRSLMLAG